MSESIEYCEDCGFPLSLCGPQDQDGEPSLDCKVCALREHINYLTSLGKQVYADRDQLRATLAQEQATVAALQQRLDEALAVLRQCHATFRAKCEGQHNWPKEQIEAIIWPHGAALAPDASPGATEGAKP